jgi:hypothetical protein
MNRRTVITSIAAFMVILGSLCSCSEDPISPDGTLDDMFVDLFNVRDRRSKRRRWMGGKT